MRKVSQEGVHLIKELGKVIGFFRRDEVSGANVIYTVNEASLEEIEKMFLQENCEG